VTHVDRGPLLRIARGPHELPAPPPPRQAPVRRAAPDDEERCEFCATEIASEHGHLVHLGRRALLCVCRACYLLFTQEGAARGLFRSVPDRYLLLPATDGDRSWWRALEVPVSLAFFVRETGGRVRGLYPSPASATEAEVPPDAWSEAVQQHPVLDTLAPEVEALLVRADDAALRAFIVPIDACYELVGRLRLSWQGLTGGDEARAALDACFERITARAGPAAPPEGQPPHP
jgi:hypothetical protein